MAIKTKRLCVLPLTPEQLELFCRDPEALYRELGLAERSETRDGHLEAAYREMLAGCTAHPKEYLWYTVWLVVLRSENRAIGDFCFKGAPNERHEAEVGYGIDEAYRRQGFATEALKALCDWAFESAFYIQAQTEPGNDASAGVLLKCGFVRAGDGEEGPLYELEKPKSSYTSTYMCLGMSCGLCFGVSFDNLALGMCIGMALGLAIGSALDARDKENRRR